MTAPASPANAGGLMLCGPRRAQRLVYILKGRRRLNKDRGGLEKCVPGREQSRRKDLERRTSSECVSGRGKASEVKA